MDDDWGYPYHSGNLQISKYPFWGYPNLGNLHIDNDDSPPLTITNHH